MFVQLNVTQAPDRVCSCTGFRFRQVLLLCNCDSHWLLLTYTDYRPTVIICCGVTGTKRLFGVLEHVCSYIGVCRNLFICVNLSLTELQAYPHVLLIFSQSCGQMTVRTFCNLFSSGSEWMADLSVYFDIAGYYLFIYPSGTWLKGALPPEQLCSFPTEPMTHCHTSLTESPLPCFL